FDSNWKDPGNYHLSLNTGHLHPTLCAEIIKHLWEQSINEETEARNEARIRELILGQLVKHHILYEKEIPVHFLECSISSGKVLIYGVANSQSLVEAALTAAREVPGVENVQSEIQVVQEYNIMP
ncbi:MAG: BON domain-containing protein, partial [Treponema sp.]|nr:BON domain-containing protein [Treponema sp.]